MKLNVLIYKKAFLPVQPKTLRKISVGKKDLLILQGVFRGGIFPSQCIHFYSQV